MFPLKLKLKTESPCIYFDLEKLKDSEDAEVFQTYVRLKFAAHKLLDTEKDTLAFDIKEVLLTTAEEMLRKLRKKIQPWTTEEVLNFCENRRDPSGKKRSSDEARAPYQRAHRKKLREAKYEWLEDQCRRH